MTPCRLAPILVLGLLAAAPALAQELSWQLGTSDGTSLFFETCRDAGQLNEVEIQTVPPDGVFKTPGSLSYFDIVCTRPLSSDTDLAGWRKLVENGLVDTARSNGCLQLLDGNKEPLAQWDLSNAWPAELRFDTTPLPSKETLVITHEGLRRVEEVPTVAVDDEYETPIDTPIATGAPGVLANDASSGCGRLVAQLLSPPPASQATVNLADDGSMSLSPAPGFIGIVSFTYEARTAVDAASATVRVGVGVPVPVTLQSFTVARRAEAAANNG